MHEKNNIHKMNANLIGFRATLMPKSPQNCQDLSEFIWGEKLRSAINRTPQSSKKCGTLPKTAARKMILVILLIPSCIKNVVPNHANIISSKLDRTDNSERKRKI